MLCAAGVSRAHVAAVAAVLAASTADGAIRSGALLELGGAFAGAVAAGSVGLSGDTRTAALFRGRRALKAGDFILLRHGVSFCLSEKASKRCAAGAIERFT